MADPNDQMGGAGTPRGGGPAVPRVDTQNLDVALATMARIAEQTEASTKATVELVRHLERVSRTSKEVGNNLDGWGTEFITVMRNSANLEYTIKRIQKLQAQRVGGGASRSGTADYIQQLQKEYKLLLQVLNTGKGQGRYVKEVDAALKGLDSTLKRVRTSNEATWDADAIQEVNRTLQETAQRVGDVQRAMSKVQVQKMTQGFHEMRKTMDDAFGGQFSQMLRRIPGVANIMQATRFRRQAGAAQEGLKTLSSQRMAMRQEAWKGAAREAVKTHGPGAMQHLRTLGYTGGRPVGNKLMSVGPLTARGRRTIGGVSAGVSQVGGSTVARAGGSLEQMSVKTMVVQQMVQGKNAAKELARADAKAGRRARFNPKTGELVGQQAETPAARTGAKRPSAKSNIIAFRRKVEGPAPDMDSVASTVAGKGGGFLSRGFNKAVTRVAESTGGRGLLGKLSTGLLSRGAGSATSGLAAGATGIGSSLLSGGLQVASKAAVPLAVVGALIAAHDKVKEENKKIQENLGGLGIHGTGREGVNFHGVRKSLLSTGLTGAAMWGQGQAENMKLMSTIGESGLAVGGSLRRGVDLHAALNQKEGLQGNGFYGSIMKNALIGGRNIGMGQEQSTRLTLKLVEKFGKTMAATQDFFLQMDDMMASSGVTASKYIEIIDSVGDQFNDMNRSLTNTVSLLNTVGKGGRLTGEAMEKMIKGLQSPNQMSMAQRMFSAQGMIQSGDNERAAGSLQAELTRDLDALHKSLKEAGVTGVESGADIAGKREAIELQLAQKAKTDPEGTKVLVASLEKTMNRRNVLQAQIGALKSNNPLGVASAEEMGGPNGTVAMYQKANTLKLIASNAGFSKKDTQALLAGDANAATRLQTSGVAALMKHEGTLQSGFDVMEAIQAQAQARRSGALAAVGFGAEAKDAKSFYDADGKLNKKGETILKLQEARGKKGDSTTLLDSFIKESKENGAVLLKELQALDETFAQVTSNGSALQESVQTLVDMQAKADAEAKARNLREETRTMAEVFAKSFEYLFDQLLNVVGKGARLLNPSEWFAKRASDDPNRWVKGREGYMQNIINGIDRSKQSPQNLQELDQITGRINSGYYRDSSISSEEKDKRLKAAMEVLKRIGGDKAKALETQMYAHNAVTATDTRNLIDPNDTSAGYWGQYSLDEALDRRQEQYPDQGRQGAVNALVARMVSQVKDESQWVDQWKGVLAGYGNMKDQLQLVEDAQGSRMVAKSEGAVSVMDAIQQRDGGSHFGAGVRGKDGTVTYNIITTPIHTAAAAAPGAAAGAAKNHAQQVKDPQK